MKENLTISKEISSDFGTEYALLRETGLRYIENLSGRLWTDYNTHDPGITILELLCYVITDLGYRSGMPVEDILAAEKENEFPEKHCGPGAEKCNSGSGLIVTAISSAFVQPYISVTVNEYSL